MKHTSEDIYYRQYTGILEDTIALIDDLEDLTQLKTMSYNLPPPLGILVRYEVVRRFEQISRESGDREQAEYFAVLAESLSHGLESGS